MKYSMIFVLIAALAAAPLTAAGDPPSKPPKPGARAPNPPAALQAAQAKPDPAAEAANRLRGLDSRTDKAVSATAQRLRQFAEDLAEELPGDLDSSGWAELADAATALERTAKEMIAAREIVLQGVQDVNGVSAGARTRIAQLKSRLKQLLENCEQELTASEDPLPEPLREAAQRELESYQRAIESCEAMVRCYSDLLGEHEESIEVIERSDGVLGRALVFAGVIREIGIEGGTLEEYRDSVQNWTARLTSLVDELENLSTATKSQADRLISPAPKPSVEGVASVG